MGEWLFATLKQRTRRQGAMLNTHPQRGMAGSLGASSNLFLRLVKAVPRYAESPIVGNLLRRFCQWQSKQTSEIVCSDWWSEQPLSSSTWLLWVFLVWRTSHKTTPYRHVLAKWLLLEEEEMVSLWDLWKAMWTLNSLPCLSATTYPTKERRYLHQKSPYITRTSWI